MIALFGVLATTWWNNKAADNRRKEDQQLAERMRLDDLAAEEKRRSAEEYRRQSEHLAELRHAERARQRKAVAECLSKLYDAGNMVSEKVARVSLLGDGTVEQARITAATELNKFYVKAGSLMATLEIEVAEPHVSARVQELWEQINNEHEEFLKARDNGAEAFLAQAEETPALSDSVLKRARALALTARLSLLEAPNFMEGQTVRPINFGESA